MNIDPEAELKAKPHDARSTSSAEPGQAAPNLPDIRRPTAHAVRDSSNGDMSMAVLAFARPDEHSDTTLIDPTVASPTMRATVTAWELARRQREMAWDCHSKAESACMEKSPPYPAAARAVDRARSLEFALAREAAEAAVAGVARRPRHPSHDVWRIERDRLTAEFGVEHLERAAQAAADETRRIRDQLIKQTVLTVGDLAAKVAVIASHLKEEDLDEEELASAMLTIHMDLQEMVSAAGMSTGG